MGSAAHMMERPASVGNRLLAALPSKDLALLAPHLQKVSLEQDVVLAQSGARRDHVYFPHSGAISFMLGLPNGETIATAVIGREGALGALSVLGRDPTLSSVTAVVRVGGTASQISVVRFQAAYMGSSGTTADMVFSVPQLIAFTSRHVTLRPGDVILTGTPDGVGIGRNPRIYMKPGALLTTWIEGIGSISNKIVDSTHRK